ncbi:LysM domain-containing protein, partial [Acinetobacter baumannii]
MTFQFKQVSNRKQILMSRNIYTNKCWIRGEFKHEVRQFEKSYDNQQAEQISL